MSAPCSAPPARRFPFVWFVWFVCFAVPFSPGCGPWTEVGEIRTGMQVHEAWQDQWRDVQRLDAEAQVEYRMSGAGEGRATAEGRYTLVLAVSEPGHLRVRAFDDDGTRFEAEIEHPRVEVTWPGQDQPWRGRLQPGTALLVERAGLLDLNLLCQLFLPLARRAESPEVVPDQTGADRASFKLFAFGRQIGERVLAVDGPRHVEEVLFGVEVGDRTVARLEDYESVGDANWPRTVRIRRETDAQDVRSTWQFTFVALEGKKRAETRFPAPE